MIQFLHDCTKNTFDFVLEIWKIVEKIKTYLNRLLLVLKIKKMDNFVKLNFFSFSKPKVVYLRPFSFFHFYILIMDEKVLVLCEKWLSKFSSNLYVLRPPEPEKMVFTKVSVCLSVRLSVCLSVGRVRHNSR